MELIVGILISILSLLDLSGYSFDVEQALEIPSPLIPSSLPTSSVNWIVVISG